MNGPSFDVIIGSSGTTCIYNISVFFEFDWKNAVTRRQCAYNTRTFITMQYLFLQDISLKLQPFSKLSLLSTNRAQLNPKLQSVGVVESAENTSGKSG